MSFNLNDLMADLSVKITLKDFIKQWGQAKVDWTFDIEPKNKNNGLIISTVEAENDLGNLVHYFKYEVATINGKYGVLFPLATNKAVYYKVPYIKVIGFNNSELTNEKLLKDLSLANTFGDRYLTIPYDIRIPISIQIKNYILFNKIPERIIYLINEDDNKDPLNAMR